MAKVTLPLLSSDARGKIAKALVFMGWKGRRTVRGWLIPANPKSAAQGNIRTIIGGTGRSCGKVIADAEYDVKLAALGVIPTDQSKQSYLVKYIKDHYMAGSGATMVANYTGLVKEFTGHTVYTTWNTKADTAGFADFELTYDDIATYESGLGLYLLAKTAIALSFTGSPYTKTLADWTGAQIDKLVAHLS